MKLDDKGRFFDYVSDCGRPLVRTAYLLTDDWHEAEALLERALARTYLSWRTAEINDPAGHTLTGVAQAYFRRARTSGRGPAAPAAEAGATWRAVQALPSEERVAVVLRIFNGMSTAQIGDVLRTSEDRTEHILIAAADRLRTALGGQAAGGRSLERVLADEMDDRVTTLPLAPSRSVLAEERAKRTLRLRFLMAAVAVAAAVPLLLWGFTALTGGDGDDAPRVAVPTAVSGSSSVPTADPSPTPTASGSTAIASPSPTPTATPSRTPPGPKGELAVPLLVGRRLVDISDGKARTVATLGAAETGTVLRAGSSYVARAGPVREPAPLVRVTEDGERSEIAASTGSVAVNGTGTRVAYTEVDDDGKTLRVVLAGVDGTEETAIDAQFDSTAVRGFVGDAVLLSHVRSGDEVARRWNPAANNFTTLDDKYGEVLAVHPNGKLAVLREAGGDCTVVAFIEFGVVYPRGRDCVRAVTAAAVSPDRKQVAAVADAELVVLDVAEGLPAASTIELDGVVRDLAWAGDGVLAVVTAPDAGADATVHECDVAAEKCTGVWTPDTPAVRLVG